MTVSSAVNRVSFSGNGVTTAFAYPYHYLDKGDLVVVLRVDATGAQTTQTITTNYTVSPDGPSEAGGTVTMITPPATGETLIIYRDPALTQTADYTDNDPFPAATHETALDRQTMHNIRTREMVTQSLRVPEAEDSVGRLPASVNRASKWFTFDANGDPTASPAPSTAGTNITLIAVSNYSSLSEADTAAAALGAVLIIDESQSVSASLTVNSRVQFIEPGRVVPASGQTITFADEVVAGRHQIFDLSSSGDIAFSNPQTVYPEWFGTANTALNSAFKKSAAGSKISLLGKEYETVAITWTNDPLASDGDDTGKVIEGVATAQRYKTTGEFYGTRIKLADGEDANVFSIDSGDTNEYGAGGFRNIQIDGNKGNNSAGSGIYVDDVKDIFFDNVDVWNCADHGFNFDGSNNQMRFLGHCESWNNDSIGFRFAAIGDAESLGALVAVNNGAQGIYIGSGGGYFRYLFAYFNTGRGIDIDSACDGGLHIDHIQVEDNETVGLYVDSPNFNIGSVYASDNGTNVASGANRSGVRLTGNACGHIQRVASVDRVPAVGQQEYLLYDASAAVTIDRFDDPTAADAYLDYDALTSDFAVGETLTGGTSGATGTILEISEATATTGTLLVRMTTIEPFADNETITDSATGSADADGASDLIRTRSANLTLNGTYAGARIGHRPPASGTYAAFKDSGGATVTPRFSQYGSYTLTGLSQTMTLNNSGDVEKSEGMTFEVSITSGGSYNVNWGSEYLDYDGTALSATALTSSQTAMARFVRSGASWILQGAIVVA